MTAAALTHSLARTVTIRAKRETVFRYFTDPDRWAAWWGAGSTIDARPGGIMRIRYPDGTEATGQVLEVVAPERIVFTYGYATGKPIASGSSLVTVHVDPHESGSRLRLTHEFAEAAVRDQHVQGWRFQLSLFGNVVANDVNANPSQLVDDWFAAWAIADDSERARAVAAIVSPSVQFGDRYSVIDGRDELVQHIGGAIRFMPGFTIRRTGDVKHCLGTLLVEWTISRVDNPQFATGTDVFVLDAAGKIASVTGFWN